MNERAELCKLLNILVCSSDGELVSAYNKKVEILKEDRFAEGDKGYKAAKKLTKLYVLYEDFLNLSQVRKMQEADFSDIDNYLKQNNVDRAQELLDTYKDRSAAWHYFQAIVYYKKKNLNASYNQLSMAIRLDGQNPKYQDAMMKLKLLLNM
ncbi:MAG: hypothetical protein FWB72_07385 [Firmicutes bacterium]|nr:hypothetical protein [Bacillota bacterium]